MLLFTAAFKNDASVAISNSSDWSSLAVYAPFAILKKYSFIGFVIIAAIGLLFFMHHRRITYPKEITLQLLILLLAFTFIRSLFYSPTYSLKVFVGALIIIFSLTYFAGFSAKMGVDSFTRKFYEALYLFAGLYIAINAINNFLGYGYVHGVPRYFGITTHPNFLGAQVALCTIVAFSRICLSPIKIIISVTITGFGLWLLLLSGSRTGIIMLLVGIIFNLHFSNTFKYKIPIITLLGFSLFIFYGYFQEEAALVYDRGSGGADTRTSAWTIMFNAFLESPIFGVGYFDKASESSFLKIIVNYGLIYFSLYIAMLVLTVRKLILLIKFNKVNNISNDFLPLSIGLLLSMLAGGILEGYLADIFGFQLITFFTLIFISAKTKRTHGRAYIKSI